MRLAQQQIDVVERAGGAGVGVLGDDRHDDGAGDPSLGQSRHDFPPPFLARPTRRLARRRPARDPMARIRQARHLAWSRVRPSNRDPSASIPLVPFMCHGAAVVQGRRDRGVGGAVLAAKKLLFGRALAAVN